MKHATKNTISIRKVLLAELHSMEVYKLVNECAWQKKHGKTYNVTDMNSKLHVERPISKVAAKPKSDNANYNTQKQGVTYVSQSSYRNIHQTSEQRRSLLNLFQSIV